MSKRCSISVPNVETPQPPISLWTPQETLPTQTLSTPPLNYYGPHRAPRAYLTCPILQHTLSDRGERHHSLTRADCSCISWYAAPRCAPSLRRERRARYCLNVPSSLPFKDSYEHRRADNFICREARLVDAVIVPAPATALCPTHPTRLEQGHAVHDGAFGLSHEDLVDPRVSSVPLVRAMCATGTSHL